MGEKTTLRGFMEIKKKNPFNELWIEKISRKLSFDKIASRISKKSHAPYFFVLTVMIIDVPILNTIWYFRTGFHPLIDAPTWLLLPPLVFFAIWGSRKIRDKFEEFVRSSSLLEHNNVKKKDFFEIPSPKLKYFFLISGLVLWMIYAIWSIPEIISMSGKLGYSGFFLFIPF
ncbi:hypothetical protein AKJ57_04040 [candidate division MSBL1 archaeon SCGC-AAA259A05]|uniref:Uncharacterized protein n=1 Tax=candidate division MSBL1 archaeon SCGC-AAA259A05 TaxID=1698259 RepID=A0A133U8Q3_9EURY|nr:hypothetical protein AKJ57_04040 [candidate division MSBL1 archaeon SCGC-AAA259A05]